MGDLIAFSGEYYIVLENGSVEWILSGETRDGLVIEKVGDVLQVLSGEEYFSIGCDHPTVQIKILNCKDEND